MYAYCSNNPVMGYDPTGYEDLCERNENNNPFDNVGPASGCPGANAGPSTNMGGSASAGKGGGGASASASKGVGGGGTSAGQACTALVPYYPPNNGFSATPKVITLNPGTLVQRIGDFKGRYLAPAGTPAPMLSLPPNQMGQPITIFEVQQPMQVLSGTVAPWFYQLGGGTQYFSPNMGVNDLVNANYLKRVER